MFRLKMILAGIGTAMLGVFYLMAKSSGKQTEKLKTAKHFIKGKKEMDKSKYETQKHIESLSDSDIDKLL